jgi:hypothetical protein
MLREHSFTTGIWPARRIGIIIVRTSLEKLYAAMDQTCLVMIDRSMWFAKSFEALSDADFRSLTERHPKLRRNEQNFREPVVYAFSYAQRVFLCSAMEMCLLYHHANSVALLVQRVPERIPSLTNLLKILKKKYGVKTLNEWVALDWEIRLRQLRELSFSNLQAASDLYDNIYGSCCFDSVWGAETHSKLASKYRKYQLLRNGILHRGGELSSGVNIEASELDIETTFEDSKNFRDTILTLSRWCYTWWLKHGGHLPVH